MSFRSTSRESIQGVVPNLAPKQRILLNLICKSNMALKLHVPSLTSPEAAQKLKETILTSEPDARVDIDTETQTVTVEAKASEETFKQLITAAGYTIA
jgi:copper chaperone